MSHSKHIHQTVRSRKVLVSKTGEDGQGPHKKPLQYSQKGQKDETEPDRNQRKAKQAGQQEEQISKYEPTGVCSKPTTTRGDQTPNSLHSFSYEVNLGYLEGGGEMHNQKHKKTKRDKENTTRCKKNSSKVKKGDCRPHPGLQPESLANSKEPLCPRPQIHFIAKAMK